jgi:hypothetical protein
VQTPFDVVTFLKIFKVFFPYSEFHLILAVIWQFKKFPSTILGFHSKKIWSDQVSKQQTFFNRTVLNLIDIFENRDFFLNWQKIDFFFQKIES